MAAQVNHVGDSNAEDDLVEERWKKIITEKQELSEKVLELENQNRAFASDKVRAESKSKQADDKLQEVFVQLEKCLEDMKSIDSILNLNVQNDSKYSKILIEAEKNISTTNENDRMRLSFKGEKNGDF